MNSMKEVMPYQPELDPIDWRTSVRRAQNAIVHHVPLILMSIVFTFGLLVLYLKMFPPIYRAEVVVQAEPDSDVNRNNYYQPWNLFRKVDVKSEPELVISGRIAKQVVDELDLKFNDVHHTMTTQIAYLWSESWVGKKYRALKEWLLPPDASAYKPTPEEIEKGRTIDAFRDGVSVDGVAGTTVGKVVVLAPTYKAAEIANKVVETYLAERIKIFKAEADKAYTILSAEVARVTEELAKVDQEKFMFDSANKVVLDFEKDKLLVGDWVKQQSIANELTGTIAGIEASLAVVQKQLQTEPAEIVSTRTLQDTKVKGLLQAREFELASSLLQMRERYLPNSPDIVQIERLLAETRSELAKEPDRAEVAQSRIVNPIHTDLRQREQSLRTQLANARAQLAAKQKPLAELEDRMSKYPQMSRTVAEQARTREGLEVRYKVLRERAMMANVSRSAIMTAPASVRVIDWATPPMKAAWPKMVYLVPGALALGLFLGFGMALLAEMFSSRVNRDRLSSRPEFPVYAVVNLRPDHSPRIPHARADALAGPSSALSRLRGPT